MSNKKKITDLLKEKCENDKKLIDNFYNFYNDDMKKEMKEMMDEKCIIEVDKENRSTCKVHLKGNPFALLFSLYVLEDNIKKEYSVPEPVADIIRLIKNDEYSSEVFDIDDK